VSGKISDGQEQLTRQAVIEGAREFPECKYFDGGVFTIEAFFVG
jgi:hypothetical protein